MWRIDLAVKQNQIFFRKIEHRYLENLHKFFDTKWNNK